MLLVWVQPDLDLLLQVLPTLRLQSSTSQSTGTIMAAKLNTEFNYRYQVIGDTPWEKLKTLKGFWVGRTRAAVLEEVSRLKYAAKVAELEHLRSIGGLPHLILNLQAEIMELDSHAKDAADCYELNRQEIKILDKLIAELYVELEPTRIPGYTDEQMFELNAANEFTVTIGREIQAEIIANGRPSPAKLRNAMSNPYTFLALKSAGLIPPETVMISGSADPRNITLQGVPDETLRIGVQGFPELLGPST